MSTRNLLLISGGVILVLCLIFGVLLNLPLTSDLISTWAAKAEAERYAALAEYEENLEDRLRAEGERELKKAEGEAIKRPACAAAFAVYVQAFLVMFWNIFISTVAILYAVAKFLYPLLKAARDKVKDKYVKPTIEMQDDTSI